MIRFLPRPDPAADRLLPPAGPAPLTVGAVAAVAAFLALLALALALAAGRIADAWGSALADAATLEIVAPADEVETQARAALNVLRGAPGVRSVRVIELEEQQALLAPWLGGDVPVDSLPLPLLIEVAVDRDAVDLAGLERRLAAEAPGAVLDDHAAWMAPLAQAAARLRLFALACVGLMAATLAAVLGMGAGAAVTASAREVETLRLVGARDGYIARAFARRLARQALAGAAVGAALAAALLALVPRGSEQGFFLAGIGLGGWQWALPLVVPPAAGLLAWLAARTAARRGLRRWS